MKRQLTSILLFSALLVGGASTFVSCKDYDSDAAYEAQAQANKTIAQLIAQQAKDVEELNGKLDRIKQCSCTDEHTLELIEQQIASNNKVIAELKRQMTDNITNDQAVKNAIATLSKQTILGSYADLNTAIQNSQAYKDIMLKLAGNNSELADSVKTIWGDLYGDTETGKV